MMKRRIVITLVLVLAAICFFAAAENEGFTYEPLEDGTIMITGYSGDASILEIPSQIDGKTVSVIGKEAFSSKSSLTTVTIPDSVTSIGNYAFIDCSSLIP